MPLRPTFLEDLLFLRLNRAPGFLFDLFAAGAFRAVALSVRLGVFDALGHEVQTVREVAQKIRSDERGTRLLLDFLESFGYIKRVNNGYANRKLSTKWLLQRSPTSLADMVSAWETKVFEYWDMHLEESVRNGKPSMTIYQWFNQNPDSWRVFNAFQMAVARWIGDQVLSQVKLPQEARSLLDLGGGHGLYSIMFCSQYPNLAATIFDHPQPLESARENIAASGLGERISMKTGDFLVDDIGSGYDVALLFNIIHHFTPEQNTELLRKVSRSLNSHGLVVIFDQISGTAPGPAYRAATRFFGLTFLATLGGETYSLPEVYRWASSAGFNKPHRTRRVPGLLAVTKAT